MADTKELYDTLGLLSAAVLRDLPAIYGGRAGLKNSCFLERAMVGGQAANTHLIENYLWFP